MDNYTFTHALYIAGHLAWFSISGLHLFQAVGCDCLPTDSHYALQTVVTELSIRFTLNIIMDCAQNL